MGVIQEALAPDGAHWIASRPDFFLPVRVLSRLFRRLFFHYLQAAFDGGKLQFYSSLEQLADRETFAHYLAPFCRSEWVVYSKPPFGGPKQVLAYLGRYTHRVAISNNRLLDIGEGTVSFRWKDYRDGNRHKTMRLSVDEFIRRFLLHVLPDGFQRIRHFGFLANRYREAKLAVCRRLFGDLPPHPAKRAERLDYRVLYEQLTGMSLRDCPVCHAGHMVVIAILPDSLRGPPRGISS